MATLNLPLGTTDIRQVVAAVRALVKGGSNATGTFTLAVSASSTTVSNVNCPAGGHVLITPATADAAAEYKNGTIYIPLATILSGSFVVQHANNTQADRTFMYEVRG